MTNRRPCDRRQSASATTAVGGQRCTHRISDIPRRRPRQYSASARVLVVPGQSDSSMRSGVRRIGWRAGGCAHCTRRLQNLGDAVAASPSGRRWSLLLAKTCAARPVGHQHFVADGETPAQRGNIRHATEHGTSRSSAQPGPIRRTADPDSNAVVATVNVPRRGYPGGAGNARPVALSAATPSSGSGGEYPTARGLTDGECCSGSTDRTYAIEME